LRRSVSWSSSFHAADAAAAEIAQPAGVPHRLAIGEPGFEQRAGRLADIARTPRTPMASATIA